MSPAGAIGSCPLVCFDKGNVFVTEGRYGVCAYCDGGCDYKCTDCIACGYDTAGSIAEGAKEIVDGCEGEFVFAPKCTSEAA